MGDCPGPCKEATQQNVTHGGGSKLGWPKAATVRRFGPCALIWTQVLFHFFFFLDPLTNDGVQAASRVLSPTSQDQSLRPHV